MCHAMILPTLLFGSALGFLLDNMVAMRSGTIAEEILRFPQETCEGLANDILEFV